MLKHLENVIEGISVKWINIILMAIVAIAFIIPAQGVAAQVVGVQTVTITGAVYSGALPMSGAKVQLMTWDGKSMGVPLKTTTTSDGSVNPKGYFQFKGVPYDASKPFNYVVMASKDDATAYAMVHIVAPVKAGQQPLAEPIFLDFDMDSWVSDVVGTVQSGNIVPVVPVQGAQVTLYSVDQTTNQTTKVEGITNPVSTDELGHFRFPGLMYGFYKVDVVKDNKGSSQAFTVYQQETNVNVIIRDLILTVKPSTKPGNQTGGWLPIPGFEALAMLVAFAGAAFVVSRRIK